ncbi:MAG TPA: SusC/RagA family TonB-linked outer membrane protein, partial [Gemmatimonadaceae bacterium]|nr:SusC/RagA family TonB-linked outer membrane protein [Gemmatimonadaceae bacterium]
ARAANGAIIITTKRGKGAEGLGITASANVTFDSPLRLPEYQNQYGQGSGGNFAWVNGAGGGTNDGVDESWGPRLDGEVRDQFFGSGPWVATPDNVRDFFRTGQTNTFNVGVTGSSEKANFRGSFTSQDVSGIIPNNSLKRLTTSLAGGAQLHERLNVDASVQYSKNQGANRPGTGYDGANPMQQFIWFGRQVDLSKLRNPRDADGNQYNWNYNYHNNPYWLAQENHQEDVRDRIIGVASVNYKIVEGVTATFRTGTDYYRDRRQFNIAAGTIGNPFGGDYSQGGFGTRQLFNRETNTDFLVTAQRALNETLDFNATVGTNLRRSSFSNDFVGTDKLVIPGTYNIGNSAVPPTVDQYSEQKRVNGVYGQFGVGYKDYLFVDVTGRNDWSSTLPDGNNSYFYPSISSSFVFTEAIPALSFGGNLGYGKLRAAWTRVGNDADAYQLYDIATQNTLFGDVPRLGIGNRLLNQHLKPEQIDAWEVGAELQFLDNRVGLDVSYYDKKSTNQILPLQVSATSGYTSAVVNAGQLSNKGVEAQLNLVPVRLDNGFEWDMTVNFAKNKSKVSNLPTGFESIQLGSYWSLSVEAREGEQYGALYGNPYLRDDAGNLVVDGDGLPQADPQRRVLGNFTPDWTGGMNNRLRYKNFEFSALVDMQRGGDIFSVTNMFGRYSGVLEESLVGREESATQQTLIIPGVKADGSVNDIATTAEGYNHSLYGIHEAHIFDASWIKLRELRVGYNASADLARRMKVSGFNIALVGRNLWLGTDVPHIDPETAFSTGNVQGIEFGQLPTVRSVGFQLSVTP